MSSSKINFQLPDEEPQSKKMAGMTPFHPDLPQVPFFVGVIGPRHTGKSVFLFNLLSQEPGMYGSSFKKHNMIVYSPTKDKDPTLKQLKLEYMYGPETDARWLVQDIMAKQRKHRDANNMTGVLLVFDDATQLRGAWGPIEDLSYTGRHDHIQVMYVAHKMSSIPRGVRTQTQQWIMFKPHEQSEMQWILDMFSKTETKGVWQNALTRAWQKPWNFVMIDYEERDVQRIYRSGFHDPLFLPEEFQMVSGQVPLSTKELTILEELKDNQDEPNPMNVRKREREESDEDQPKKKKPKRARNKYIKK